MTTDDVQATDFARRESVVCPRCGRSADATVSEPWTRRDEAVEWVTVVPHAHGRTGRSTCRPKGYARRVR